MRMSVRTDASEALERLAWTLNFHEGDSLSVNKLAEKTDLSWATANKYSQVLERLSRISPELNREGDGVSVELVGKNLSCIRDRPETQLIVYLIVHAENQGGSIEPIPIEAHQDVLNRYESSIDHLVDIGWIAIDDEEDTIQLTPAGAAQAGQARSQLRNTNMEPPSQGQIVDKGDVIRVSDVDMQSRWATREYSVAPTSQGSDEQSASEYRSGEYRAKRSSAGWVSA